MAEVLLVEDDAACRAALLAVLAERHQARATPLARVALGWLRDGIALDVAVVDLGLPDADGVDLVRALLAARPAVPVVVLTVDDTRERVLAALDAGAAGYLLKERAGRELLPALDAVLAGDVALSPRAARHVVDARRGDRPPVHAGPAPLLTPAERRVLEELARGLSYAQIGLVLDVSINTVRSRIRSLFDKLGASSATEAIAHAARVGLVRLNA